MKLLVLRRITQALCEYVWTHVRLQRKEMSPNFSVFANCNVWHWQNILVKVLQSIIVKVLCCQSIVVKVWPDA